MGHELRGESVCFVVGGSNSVVTGGCGEEFQVVCSSCE